MKKRIFKSYVFAALAASIPLSVLTTILSYSNTTNQSSSQNDSAPQLLSSESNLATTIEKNESISRSPNINIFNKMEARIIKDDLERTINSQVYETELTKEFQDKFKYPAWNFNYEGNRNQTIDGKTIDGMQRVWEERVQFKDQKVTYNNTAFILDEIANNLSLIHISEPTRRG